MTSVADEPYGPGLNLWESSCLNASRRFSMERDKRICELEDEHNTLKAQLTEFLRINALLDDWAIFLNDANK